MTMTAMIDQPSRKTSSDVVFDTLYRQITQLELLPGTKISEAETAKEFGLSRQPVREAFTRLAGLNLLLIRPQRATIVRPFSRTVIDQARFIRSAVEFEVVRCASRARVKGYDAEIRANLKAQRKAISKQDATRFHDLDYQFHRLLCASANKAFAFEIIAANKAQVDRLCMLALTDADAMTRLESDHTELVEAIFRGDEQKALEILRVHLERLAPTISAIQEKHSKFFESADLQA